MASTVAQKKAAHTYYLKNKQMLNDRQKQYNKKNYQENEQFREHIKAANRLFYNEPNSNYKKNKRAYYLKKMEN